MFLNGLLFGIGWVVGAGLVSTAAMGLLALLDWTSKHESNGKEVRFQDNPSKALRRLLIVEAQRNIESQERMIQLLQQMDQRGEITREEHPRMFRIQ